MSDNRESVVFRLESSYGSSTDPGPWRALPPGARFDTSLNISNKRITSLGRKFADTFVYGRVAGTWSLKFVADYGYLDPLLLAFESYEYEPSTGTHHFRKANNQRPRSFTVRYVRLNRIAGGPDGSDEINYYFGCVCKEFKINKNSETSEIEVEMSGLLADTDLRTTNLSNTDFTKYLTTKDDKAYGLMEWACLFFDSIESDSYVEMVDSAGLSMSNAVDSLYSICTPISPNFMEGKPEFQYSFNAYANDIDRVKRRVFTGGRSVYSRLLPDMKANRPLGKGMSPMQDMYLVSYTGSMRDDDGVDNIKDAFDRSEKKMVVHMSNCVFDSTQMQSGDGSKLMDSISGSKCGDIEVTVVSPCGDILENPFQMFEEARPNEDYDSEVRKGVAYLTRYKARTIAKALPDALVADGTVYSTYRIGDKAFQNIPLDDTMGGRLVIPDSVTAIGDNAFDGCGISDLVIGNGVTRLGAYAFANNVDMTSLTIPVSLVATGIDKDGRYCTGSNFAFIQPTGGYRLTTVRFTKGTGVGPVYTYSSATPVDGLDALFKGLNLPDIRFTPWFQCRTTVTSVTFGDGVSVLGSFQMAGLTKVTSVTLPQTFTKFGAYCFFGAGVTSVNFGSARTNNMFSPRSVTIGASVYSIPTIGVFYGSSIDSIPFETPMAIPPYTFELSSCTQVGSIEVPAMVTKIGMNAFKGCTVGRFVFGNELTEIGQGALALDWAKVSDQSTIEFKGSRSATMNGNPFGDIGIRIGDSEESETYGALIGYLKNRVLTFNAGSPYYLRTEETVADGGSEDDTPGGGSGGDLGGNDTDIDIDQPGSGGGQGGSDDSGGGSGSGTGSGQGSAGTMAVPDYTKAYVAYTSGTNTYVDVGQFKYEIDTVGNTATVVGKATGGLPYKTGDTLYLEVPAKIVAMVGVTPFDLTVTKIGQLAFAESTWGTVLNTIGEVRVVLGAGTTVTTDPFGFRSITDSIRVVFTGTGRLEYSSEAYSGSTVSAFVLDGKVTMGSTELLKNCSRLGTVTTVDGWEYLPDRIMKGVGTATSGTTVTLGTGVSEVGMEVFSGARIGTMTLEGTFDGTDVDPHSMDGLDAKVLVLQGGGQYGAAETDPDYGTKTCFKQGFGTEPTAISSLATDDERKAKRAELGIADKAGDWPVQIGTLTVKDTSLGRNAFDWCNIGTVELGKDGRKPTFVGTHVFDRVKVDRFVLNDCLPANTDLAKYMFYGYNKDSGPKIRFIESLEIDNSSGTAYDSVFSYCMADRITFKGEFGMACTSNVKALRFDRVRMMYQASVRELEFDGDFECRDDVSDMYYQWAPIVRGRIFCKVRQNKTPVLSDSKVREDATVPSTAKYYLVADSRTSKCTWLFYRASKNDAVHLIRRRSEEDESMWYSEGDFEKVDGKYPKSATITGYKHLHMAFCDRMQQGSDTIGPAESGAYRTLAYPAISDKGSGSKYPKWDTAGEVYDLLKGKKFVLVTVGSDGSVVRKTKANLDANTDYKENYAVFLEVDSFDDAITGVTKADLAGYTERSRLSSGEGGNASTAGATQFQTSADSTTTVDWDHLEALDTLDRGFFKAWKFSDFTA